MSRCARRPRRICAERRRKPIVGWKAAPRSSLPQGDTRVLPGPRARLLADPAERGTIPSSLQLVIDHVGEQLSVEELLFALTAPRPAQAARAISYNEACAALVAAQHLDWIAL